MLKDMGRLKIKDSFTNFLKDWRSGVFTLILVLAFFFNLIISENEHAEAGHAATPTKDIQAVVPEPQAPAVIRTNRETELARGSNLMYHLESEGISRSDSNAVIAVLQDVGGPPQPESGAGRHPPLREQLLRGPDPPACP